MIGLEAAGSKATVGSKGGSIDVTSKDGTRFTLDIPADALLGDTEVTTTPVATFGNLGFDAHGVVFGPLGLNFLHTAKLTITPKKDVPVDRQLMFFFSDDGTQFGAAEPQLDTKKIVIMVPHFSGYAFGDVSLPSKAQFLQRQASAAADRITGEVGKIFLEERQSQLLNEHENSALLDTFEKYSKQWEEQVIKPRLDAAKSSCAAGQLAIATVLSYERQRQLIGAATSFTAADIYNLLAQAFPVCEEEAITKCKAAKDPSILMALWAGFNRQGQLLGGADFAPLDEEKAKKICKPVWTASGGGDGLTLSGIVEDLTKPFTLNGSFPGATVQFAYFPTDEHGGAHTYMGSGSGMTLSGNGDYTISGEEGGTLTLTGHSHGCVNGGGCRDTTEVVTLTPG